jgi:hypothetical protein
LLAKAIIPGQDVKWFQIGKEEVKLSLFADDMIQSLKDPKNFTKRNLLEIINFSGKVAGYKINIQKSVGFIHTNNEWTEKEVRKITPFIITSKKKRTLGINFMKKTKELCK